MEFDDIATTVFGRDGTQDNHKQKGKLCNF